MAILHNLTDPTDNLTGFDPVEGIPDGTTVGKSWLLWKIFEGLAAFDTNIKKITDAEPTPAFLRAQVGSNLQTEPAMNRGTTGDSIKFYMANDPGLSQTPANAIIYEWRITSATSTGGGICTVRVHHLADGGIVYSPGADNVIVSGSVSAAANVIYAPNMGSTTTLMVNIPKVIFWKSSNANLLMGISKADGTYKGYLIWYNPAFTGYRVTTGATTEGVSHRATVFINGDYGETIIEAFTQTYAGALNSVVSNLSPLCSAGSLPTALFNFGGINNLIAGKLRFALKNDTVFKSISEEIEGIRLTNPANAALLSAGGIAIYNGKYFLAANLLHDGRETHKVLLELEAVP